MLGDLPIPHGFLLIDKPSGMTSHDVVSRIRRLLGTKKVGHAGTLDPAAEGLMIVAVGAATRLLPYLTDATKEYVAHIVLGRSTDSADIEGSVIGGFIRSRGICSVEVVRNALQHQIGSIEQTPPAFSAIKQAGQPLYRRARRGEAVEVPSRTVTIYAADLLDYAYPDCIVRVCCSSGTYIRSIARDLGEALETGAYLHHLLRTRVGPFDLLRSWTLPEIERLLSISTWSSFALHPDVVAASWPAHILDPEDERAWYDGRPITNSFSVSSIAANHARVFDADGGWVGIATLDKDHGYWRPKLVVARSKREQQPTRRDT